MRSTHILGMLLAAALVVTGCDGGSLPTVDVRQAAAMQELGALLLDVRQPEEHAEVRASDSVLLPLGSLQSRLGELAQYKDKPVVVICRSGRRSGLAVQQLQQAGFILAVNVAGGMNSWQEAGLPVRRGAQAI